MCFVLPQVELDAGGCGARAQSARGPARAEFEWDVEVRGSVLKDDLPTPLVVSTVSLSLTVRTTRCVSFAELARSMTLFPRAGRKNGAVPTDAARCGPSACRVSPSTTMVGEG